MFSESRLLLSSSRCCCRAARSLNLLGDPEIPDGEEPGPVPALTTGRVSLGFSENGSFPARVSRPLGMGRGGGSPKPAAAGGLRRPPCPGSCVGRWRSFLAGAQACPMAIIGGSSVLGSSWQEPPGHVCACRGPGALGMRLFRPQPGAPHGDGARCPSHSGHPETWQVTPRPKARAAPLLCSCGGGERAAPWPVETPRLRSAGAAGDGSRSG